MDTISLRIPTSFITDFSLFTASSSVRSGRPVICVNVANGMCQFLDVFNKSTVYLEDAFPLYNSGYVIKSFWSSFLNLKIGSRLMRSPSCVCRYAFPPPTVKAETEFYSYEFRNLYHATSGKSSLSKF
jgi:hypothetical protein